MAFEGLEKTVGKEILGVKTHKIKILLFSTPIPFIAAIVASLLGLSSTSILATFSFGVIGIFTPYMVFGYLEFKEIRDAEEGYPNFLRDLTQSVNSGMTLPQAVATSAQTKYGVLSKYVTKLNAWLSWGTPFPEAWQRLTLALEKSELIKRINGIVLEAFHSGGDISDVLNALADDVALLKRLEADKKSLMQEHIVVMYIVFFIFISIIVILFKILIPILYIQQLGVFGGLALRPAEQLSVDYFKNLFFLLTIIQAACMGLIAGQITEEKMIAGAKHIAIMVAIGAFAFFAFIFPSFLTLQVNVFPENPALNQKVTITGSVYFEAQPAAGAKIDIVTPQKEIITVFTDGLGEFDTFVTAPTQPGTYILSVTATYRSETQMFSKTITVGAT
jgi:archaellum biogenesis protein FlaJ (TadC family)